MSTQNKFRQDKRISRVDLSPNELNINYKKVVTSTADYYSEWAIEKCAIQNPKPKKFGNSAKPAPGNANQPTNYDQYY